LFQQCSVLPKHHQLSTSGLGKGNHFRNILKNEDQMSILLENVSKIFDSDTVVKDLSLKIEEGKTTVLIGPSGCGKSTLIRVITGLIKAEEGRVLIDNFELSESNYLKVRRNIGYVIQDGGLFPHLNAFQNVSIVANYIGWGKDKIRKRVEELSSLTKFPSDGLRRFPTELSGGQKQRVSLMRALMLDPQFLLLDEPLAALDPLIRYDLQGDLKGIFQRLKKTVLLVTHDLNEAVFFGDTIVLMREGEIIQKGKINDFINSPSDEFVTRFIKAQRSGIEA
jgi:osmoprotectant transport system ATP-binding protein